MGALSGSPIVYVKSNPDGSISLGGRKMVMNMMWKLVTGQMGSPFWRPVRCFRKGSGYCNAPN